MPTTVHEPFDTLDAAAVLALLPHRYPFLLVDRITVVEPGRRVLGRKQVTAGEWAGPAVPEGTLAMPGLLVVEALAQTSAALLLGLLDASEGAVGYFVGMHRVRLRDAARPGDTLQLAVELRSFRRGIARLLGTGIVEGRGVAASAEFTTIVRPRA
jgi:3-hydroxyacyl-[acyl-carrier-protein] dehydratase